MQANLLQKHYIEKGKHFTGNKYIYSISELMLQTNLLQTNANVRLQSH